VLPEQVTILAETALKPEEIDRAGAQEDLQRGQKMWSEAGDDPDKYEDAIGIIRKAEEELASADGKSS
jgi:F-type H+-transporting ATPase subunit epsilon